jgi:1,4-alpha-glucan branching enzyme
MIFTLTEDRMKMPLGICPLANKMIQEIRPGAISIAEDMSGYPGLAVPVDQGGVGFNYRLAMGTPDYWIKTIKERGDEQWNMSEIFHELTLQAGR